MKGGIFEVLGKDLMGRIGLVETRHGRIETPAVAPVINPLKNPVSPPEIHSIGFEILTTNALIIMRSFGEEAIELGVHGILGVNCPVMTDSGAYQLLVYGYVDVSPDDILRFQARAGSDIGVILDIPTKYGASKEHTALEVLETIRRARRALMLSSNEGWDMLLVGPIQGGLHLELARYCAHEMSKLDFDIYAIGSPTPLLEEYRFDELVDLIMAVKSRLPPDKPVHLFGAGHPMMLSFAVALGCDLFDSASYAIYAKDGRYMTERGTIRIDFLRYLPCSCPACSNVDVDEITEMGRGERERFLALHNLYVMLKELRTIKQAINEGSLWELLEVRGRGHPALYRALRRMCDHSPVMERWDAVTSPNPRGIFLFDATSLYRPEVLRHIRRLEENYSLGDDVEVLILVPETEAKPFHRFGEISRLVARLKSEVPEIYPKLKAWVYSPFLSVIPLDIDDVFPLSQFESSGIDDRVVLRISASRISSCLRRILNRSPKLELVVLVSDGKWDELISSVESECGRARKELRIIEAGIKAFGEDAVDNLISILRGFRPRNNRYQNY